MSRAQVGKKISLLYYFLLLLGIKKKRSQIILISFIGGSDTLGLWVLINYIVHYHYYAFVATHQRMAKVFARQRSYCCVAAACQRMHRARSMWTTHTARTPPKRTTGNDPWRYTLTHTR